MTLILNGGDRQITLDDILLDEIEEQLEGVMSNHTECSPLVADAPPKINHPQGWIYFCRGPAGVEVYPPLRGKSLQVHQIGIGRTPISSAAASP